jgi:hypothetical protein
MIMKMLGKGPVEQQAIRAEARAAGIAWRTMERAKCDLGVVSRRQGFGPGSIVLWELPTEGDTHTPPTVSLAVYDDENTSGGGVVER